MRNFKIRENQFKGWIPEFGNGHHKFIISMMEEYYAIRDKYEDIIKSKRQDEELKRKCVFMKQNIRKMLKDDRKARFLRQNNGSA